MLRARELSGPRLPARLRDLLEPPERVFVVGEIPPGPGVAIVGTRTPTKEAAQYARLLAQRLAELGVVVYSGGAKGIDTEAHNGALDGGGPTVVIAPSSFDCPYPEKNGPLFERVVREGGAFVSLYREEVKPAQAQFFARNACLAALCHSLVVVESRFRGGARNAAKWARSLGRTVFAVPSGPWVVTGAGCLAEIKLGARMLTSADDVVDALRGQNVHPFCAGPSRPLKEVLDGSAASVAASRVQQSLELPLLSPPFGATFWPPHAMPFGGPMAPPALRDTVCEEPSDPGRKEPERTTNERDFDGVADRGKILGVLALGPAHPDELCRTTGLSAHRVQALLLTLTLEGILVSHPSGHVSRIK